MRKAMIALLAVLLTAAPLFAGGGGQKAAASAIPKDQPIKIVFWHHQVQAVNNFNEFAKIATEIFAKLGYPNVSMVSEQIEYSGYLAKYISAFSSNTGPDMFMAMVPDFALEGGANPVALPLPDDIAKAWQGALGDIYKNEGMLNGKYYGFPVAGDTFMFMFINEDHFREAGLDPDKDYPKTYDEFREVAKKLTKYDASGKVTRAGWQPRFAGGSTNVAAKYLPIINNFGGRVLSTDLTKAQGYINSPETTKAFQYLHDLVYVDKVTNVELGLPDVAFQSGLCSMTFREPFYANQVSVNNPNIKYKIYPMPAGVKDYTTTGSGNWIMMINSKSKYVDLLLQMYRELINPEYDVRMHQADKTPPVLTGTLNMNNAYFRSLPYAQAQIDCMKKPLGPFYYTIKEWNTMTEIIGDTVTAIVEGKDVKSSLDDAAKKMQTVLDEQ